MCSKSTLRHDTQYCVLVQSSQHQPEPTDPTVPATPAPYIQDLRHAEIVQRVRSDPRTDGDDLLLGVDRATAMEAIKWGQADFDQPIGTLSTEDRVLLYAYWNQPGHVAELSEAFQQLFSSRRPSDPLVVDLGCGPFTGGLAFAGQLGARERFDYIGIDRSREMRRFGEKLAAALAGEPEAPTIRHQWAPDVSSVDWTPPKRWRPVLVIVSFLLASPTLDVKALLAELSHLLQAVGRGEVIVLYTNSAKAGPNRKLPAFREGLLREGFRQVVNEVGTVKTERATRSLRYALFHRPKQRKLPLGGD